MKRQRQQNGNNVLEKQERRDKEIEKYWNCAEYAGEKNYEFIQIDLD